MELQKILDAKPAHFEGNLVKVDIQTDLILKLLCNSIEETKPISRDDILTCYLDFVFYGKTHVFRSSLYRGESKRRDGYFDREELSGFHRYLAQPSIDWFKKHLGSAILKGKILAIPVIDI